MSSETHCFSIVPESVEEKRALPVVLRPPPDWEEENGGAGELNVDLLQGPSQQRGAAWDAQVAQQRLPGGDDGLTQSDGRLVYPHHDELALLETWTDALGREQRIHPRSRQLYGPAGTAIVFSNSNFHAGTCGQRHIAGGRREPVAP